MCRGCVGITMHVPPYCRVGRTNLIVGLNTVGLRRAPDMNDEDRRQIVEAFKLTYRSGLTTSRALEEMDLHTEWGAAADKFRQFVRRVLHAEGRYKRGLCTAHAPRR
jgi:acyl-[acyl carrier protein]--UDP-N-acetylglucosamine O-acyltransferase